jgi:hypothetical protein
VKADTPRHGGRQAAHNLPKSWPTGTVRAEPTGGAVTATQDDMIAELQRANAELHLVDKI